MPLEEEHPSVTYRTLRDVIDHLVLPIPGGWSSDFDVPGIAARVNEYCPKCSGFHIRPIYDANSTWYAPDELNLILEDHDLTKPWGLDDE